MTEHTLTSSCEIVKHGKCLDNDSVYLSVCRVIIEQIAYIQCNLTIYVKHVNILRVKENRTTIDRHNCALVA